MNIFEKLQNNTISSYIALESEKPNLRVYNTFEKNWISFQDLKITNFKPNSEVQISDIPIYISDQSKTSYNFNISENIVVKPKSFSLVIVESDKDDIHEIKYGSSSVIQTLETLTLARNNGFIFEYKDKANKEGIYAILCGFSYEQNAQGGNYFYIKITCNFKEIFDFKLNSDFASSTTSITKVDSKKTSTTEASSVSRKNRNMENSIYTMKLEETYLIDLNLNFSNFYKIQTQIYLEQLNLIFCFKYNDFDDKFYIEILSENLLIYNGILRYNNEIPGPFGWEVSIPNNLKPLGKFTFLPKTSEKTGCIKKQDFLNKRFNLFYNITNGIDINKRI